MKRRTSQRPVLTPNAPLSRLGFIRKTYEKQPWVAYDTLSVIFNTIGIDEPFRALEDAIWATGQATDLKDTANARGTVLEMFRGGRMVPGLPDPRWGHARDGYATLLSYAWNLGSIKDHGEDDLRYDDRANVIFQTVDKQQFAEGAMHEPHEADSIFPWVARELSRLTKHTIAAIEESIKEKLSLLDDFTDYTDALETLRKSTNLFAQWAKAKRVDIMKMSLAEVIEATKDFKYTGKIRQGKIVLRLADGWTVQELRGRRELAPEGKCLAHCVGTYVQKVDNGQHEIYSLRDPDGVPYVTMDWKNERPEDDINTPPAPVGVTPVVRGEFKQVFGFDNSNIGSFTFNEHVFNAGQANEPPLTRRDVDDVVEMIRRMVVEFIDKVKGGDVTGLILAGQKELSDRNMSSRDLSFKDLSGTNLSGSNLSGAGLNTTNLSNANLSKANLSRADMRDSKLNNAKLSGANLEGANLRFAALEGADMSDAIMSSSTDVKNATYDGDTVWPAGFDPITAGANNWSRRWNQR